MTLLDTATRDLTHSTSAADKAVARTRIAVYAARRGDEHVAREHAALLRAEESPLAYSLAVAGANLVEGVLAYCASEQTVAVDRLRRCQALAASARADTLERWSNAWLAHVAFDVGHLVQVHERAALALNRVQPGEHAVISRVAATIGVALHFGDRLPAAKSWYELSRRHAVTEGDDLTIDALLYNVAAMRANNLRLQQLDDRMDRTELERADLEFRSSLNYDRLKASNSFRWTLPILEAHLAVLREEFEQAAGQLEGWISSGFGKAPARQIVDAKAELAFCYAKLGRLEEAIGLASDIKGPREHDTSDDEVAMVKYRHSQVAGLAGRRDEAERLLAEARTALEAHKTEQAAVADAIAKIGTPSSLGLL